MLKITFFCIHNNLHPNIKNFGLLLIMKIFHLGKLLKYENNMRNNTVLLNFSNCI